MFIDHICNEMLDQINELAQIYPGLMEFQSLELSPYSWMAVAWYVRFIVFVTCHFQLIIPELINIEYIAVFVHHYNVS